MDKDTAQALYWDILYIIEPALRDHVPCAFEPIEEKSERYAMQTLAKFKTCEIMDKLRDAGLVPAIIWKT